MTSPNAPSVPSTGAVVRTPRRVDRDAVIAAIRAAGLLPDDGVDEMRADLNSYLAGAQNVGAWLVDAVDATIAGVAFYAPERMTDRTWNLYLLAVHPDRQREGRGQRLIRAVEDDLRYRNARLLVIETSGTLEFASQRRFYQRLGYQEQGRVEEFYETGDAKVAFAKPLTAAVAAPPEQSVAFAAEPQLRVAEPGDQAPLLGLAEASYQEHGFTTPRGQLAANLSSLIDSDEAHVCLAMAANDLVGFAITTTSFGLENGLIAELEDLYVTPTARRGGLGARLVQDSAAWARDRGCSQLEVVLAPNGHSTNHLNAYYQRLDFIDEGRCLRRRALTAHQSE